MGADPTTWRMLAHRLSWVRQALDVAGSASWFLALVAGLSLVTAVVGFFTEHPSVAIALAVIVGYYGFRLFERAHLWWRRESVDTKLHIEPLIPLLFGVNATEGTCNISVVYRVTNTAPFDVYFYEDQEDFWVGTIHPEPALKTPPEIFPPQYSSVRGSRIFTIPIGEHAFAHGQISLRCGKSRKAMNVRRFFSFQSSLPREVSSETDGADTWNITRNDLEWVMSD